VKAQWVLFVSMVLHVWGQVSFDRILGANKESHNWLTYSGALMGQRYSPLTQITPTNVKDLELQRVFPGSNDGRLAALDAATGKEVWVVQTTPRRGRVHNHWCSASGQGQGGHWQ
jgi:glucose dehydrogenase